MKNISTIFTLFYAFCFALLFCASAAQAQLSVTIEKTDPLCYLGSDGKAKAIPSGGISPYSFAWSNNRSTPEITGLQSGFYGVTITDAVGNTASSSTVLDDPQYLITELVLDDTLLTCQDRLIIATNNPTGGIAPYHYEWLFPNTNIDSNQSITISDPGTYRLTVIDAHLCTYETSFKIRSVGFPVLTTYLIDSITCNGKQNGNAAVHIEDGVQPYDIIWSNGDRDTLLNNVGAGSYLVTVTDDNGCSNLAAVNVPQPQQLGIDITHSDITCFGDRSGSVFAEVTGGTEPYSFFWDNGAMTQGQTNLPAGTYSVTVTDHHGCSITGSTTILQGVEINVVMFGQHVTCFGGNNGSASAIAADGEFPYTYNWSNGATGNQIHNLVAGKYYVTVVDARNCSAVDSVTINQPFQITLEMESTPENFGMMDGTAKTTAALGIRPYTYAWSNGGTTQQISGLTAGDYYVTVTDANGCTATGEVYVAADNCAMEFHLQEVNVSCHGESDGGVFPVFDIPGAEPYTFAWSNGSTEPVLMNVSAGVYTVTITDNTNCSESARVTVSQPDGFNINYTIQQPSGPDQSTGTIRINITGGNSPYKIVYKGVTYQDDDLLVIPNIPPGDYTWTVTDNRGCTAEFSFKVKPYTCYLSVSVIEELSINCPNEATARICAIPDNNLGNVSYSWSNGTFNQCADNLRASTYSVVVTDTVGCSATTQYTVNEPTEISFSNLRVVPGTGSNGSISLIVSGGTPPYNFNWTKNSIQFATTRDIAGLSKGTYVLAVTDSKGCRVVFDAIVLNPSSTLSLAPSNSISLSPNPVRDRLHILFEKPTTNLCRLSLFDLTGRKIIDQMLIVSNDQAEFSVASLHLGLYLIKLQSGNLTYTSKLLRVD